ncbi:response regulator [Rhodoferax aquaticus]|uniref:Response regulator n=1 Tax=Rhodoferax aquaticus TaxID=2527691 RepID=A0A515EQ14_9BURK|nr:response regulator [Rhodoferax aquaticus]QDL54762.1 response regulator [Rhodoferax aquaticus]
MSKNLVQSNASPLVMVVDDDDFSRDFLSEMLTELGVRDVHCAVDGRQALKAMKMLPRYPDFLVCDIFMPDMDGIEFLAELAKSGYRGSIMLVSGEDASMMHIAQEVALANGLQLMGAYTKPVAMATLAQALAKLLPD